MLANPLSESTIGLYKSALIAPKVVGGMAEVERRTASWVYWLTNTRLHSSIGYTSPTDYENDDYRLGSTAAASDHEVT
ncbi:transposase [Rhodococcus corynebacterioides]|nr:transposase [Rhodococcus corynebacterioides]